MSFNSFYICGFLCVILRDSFLFLSEKYFFTRWLSILGCLGQFMCVWWYLEGLIFVLYGVVCVCGCCSVWFGLFGIMAYQPL